MGKSTELAKKVKKDADELVQILESAETEKREQSGQTKAVNKWNDKNGMMSKSYKLKAETVEAFNKVCKEKQITQSEALTELMQAFINNDGGKRGCFLCRVLEAFKGQKKKKPEKTVTLCITLLLFYVWLRLTAFVVH